jgi:AraC-like DNA-binding protein
MLHNRNVYALTLKKARMFMHSLGHTDEELLAGTEVDAAQLDDPYSTLSQRQARLFYRNLVRLVGGQGIGLELGWTTSISEKGPVGLLQISSRTVREALQDGWKNRYAYDMLVNWEYKITDNLVINRFGAWDRNEEVRIFLLERALGLVQAHAEELAGSDVVPGKVLLGYAAPRDLRRYKEIFRCPLLFNQKITEIHYPAQYLERALESYDPRAHDTMEALQTRLLNNLAKGPNVLNEVKVILRRDKGVFPSLEDVAGRLAISSRTLRRKLGQRGVRFQDLLDQERRLLAEECLVNTDISLEEIAERCDYSDAQSFSQAFRRMTGMTPTEFRKSQH